MNGPLASLWQSRHRPTLLGAALSLGAALLLGGVALAWSGARWSSARFALQTEQQAYTDDEQFAQELAELQAQLPQRELESHALKAEGFLQETDRVAWAEQVATTALALRPIAYSATVGTPQWLPLPDEAAAWYLNQGLETPGLHATDLVLQVQGLHEDELRRLMDTALRAAGGVTRIEQCRMLRRIDGIGLDVDCTLRRFGIGMPQGEDAPDAMEYKP